MTKKRAGRPKIKLNYELIEKLSYIQCTQEEIASIVGVHRSTLLRDEEFCRIYKKGIRSGKMSLRRLQWKSAEKGNVTMLIYLGKQYLGQREGIGVSFETPLEINREDLEKELRDKLDATSERMKKAKKLKKEKLNKSKKK